MCQGLGASSEEIFTCRSEITSSNGRSISCVFFWASLVSREDCGYEQFQERVRHSFDAFNNTLRMLIVFTVQRQMLRLVKDAGALENETVSVILADC